MLLSFVALNSDQHCVTLDPAGDFVVDKILVGVAESGNGNIDDSAIFLFQLHGRQCRVHKDCFNLKFPGVVFPSSRGCQERALLALLVFQLGESGVLS